MRSQILEREFLKRCIKFILIEIALINQFCVKVYAQTEISRSFFSPISTDDNWIAYQAQNSNHITNCVTSDIYGGRSVFSAQTFIMKMFIMPPHYKIQFELQFWRLDPWYSQSYIIYVDGENAHSYNPQSPVGTEICGSGSSGEIDQISKSIDHFGNSAIIIIVSKQSSASWGISNFKLFVLKCPKNCHFCDYAGVCQSWYRLLTYFTTLTFTDGQGWEKNNSPYYNSQYCGFQYYGNFLQNQVASINLNLNTPHSMVKILFTFLCSGINNSVTLEVIGDAQLYYYAPILPFITTSNTICGTYFQMGKIYIIGSSHSSPTLTISIVIHPSVNTAQFGIRDFEVFTYTEGLVIKEDDIVINDNLILPIEGYFSQQFNCVEGCSNCIRELCFECFSGWSFDENFQMCLPYCGDKIIVLLEECDDGNLQPNDGCYQCKFSCPLNCIQCEYGQCLFCSSQYQLFNNQCVFSCYEKEEHNLIQYHLQITEGHFCPISNFLINNYEQHIIINKNLDLLYQGMQCQLQNYGIFAYQYNQCFYLKPQNCQSYFLNECHTCINEFENKFDNQCFPICNNGIIQEEEQCDDQNLIQFDGCFQCSSSCQLECLDCQNSFCFQCLQGWNLIDFLCVQECGDGIIALSSQEQCDDQNQEQGDGCYECKFECQYNCIFCNGNLECAICKEYFEIKDNLCIPICGDGYIIEGLEICDDGNDIKYDGCYDCEYSCQENCQICDHQNCLDNCDYGYYQVDFECNSICGDSIVALNEQCDDANDDAYDGCYLCVFSCPQNCLHCHDQQCFQCDHGFKLINNNCQDICGNGFKSDQVQCDDGNLLSQDGCSETCEIELNWTCIQVKSKNTSCFLITPPHFNLILLNQTFDVQFVQIQFTDQIKLLDSSQNLTQNLKASLIDINPLHYTIANTFIIEPNNQSVHNIIYFLRIQILEQQTSEIFLQVQLNTLLVDRNGFQVDNDICKIHINNPLVLTETQRMISHKISSYNMLILIALGVSSMIILISGNPAECFEVLDTIQYQSNLKFININFPENLIIYFQSSEVVSIFPILEKFLIVDLYQDIIGQQQSAYGQFLKYNINSDLITNLIGLITQLGLITLLLILSFCYLNFIFYSFFTQICLFINRNHQILLLSQFGYLINKLNEVSLGLLSMLSRQGAIYILQANSWDLIFKSLLFLFSKKEISYRNTAQSILAVSILISIAILMSSFFSQSLSRLKQKKISFGHESLIIAKKFLILIILISSQNNSIIQCVMIACVNTMYITTIILSKMTKNKIDLITILVFEIPIVIFTLLSLSFDPIIATHLNNETQIIIGFLLIGLLSLGLAAPLVKYAFQIKIKLAKFILKFKQKRLKEKLKQKRSTQIFY